MLASNFYTMMRKDAASLKIQTNWRWHVFRMNYNLLRNSTIAVQTCIRAVLAREKFIHRRNSKTATVIQAHWRGHRVLSFCKRLVKAAIVIQSRWRGLVARRELRKLKMESRETGALQEANDKLKKLVEDLKSQLQLERRLRADLERKLHQSSNAMETRGVEENTLPEAEIRIDGSFSINEATMVPVDDTEKIEARTLDVENTDKIAALTLEVKKLKDMLQSEKQRADDLERRYAEALETVKGKQQKLEETERRVHQLQESLNSAPPG